MRYSLQTKKFWKLGWRLFGGRFLNFMGGDIVLQKAAKGFFPPKSSEINFAVPDIKALRQFDPYSVEGERKPGVFANVIRELSLALKGHSACITFDGKKLKQSLTKESGDVDLLGFEKGLSLHEKKNKLDMKLLEVEEVLVNLETTDQKHVIKTLIKGLKVISEDSVELSNLKAKKEYGKSKLIERSGDLDWRKGKYVYAISAIIAFIHDIDRFLDKARDVLQNICSQVAI